MSQQNKSKKSIYLSLIILIVISCCITAFNIQQKERAHIDEIWSYGLSNGYEKPFLYDWKVGLGDIGSISRDYVLKEGEKDPFYQDKFNAFYEQWHDGKEFNDYITVQENHRFDYANVYHNQVCDTHPPLFYFFVHTVCSFFPEQFSLWFIGSLNIVFFALSLLTLFFLAKEILNSEIKALFAVGAYGFSRAGATCSVFLRMYMLGAFLTILLVYFQVKLIKNFKAKYLIGIFIANVAGFLTQYYFYIFSFFITACVCFYMLFGKNIKQLIMYSLSVLGSVGVALIIFPATLYHLGEGVYTSDTVAGISDVWSFSLYNRFLYYMFQNYLGFGGFTVLTIADIICIIAAVLIIIKLIKFLNSIKNLKGDAQKNALKEKADNLKNRFISFAKHLKAPYIIIIISILLSGFVIDKICPDMGIFQDRYFFMIFPLCAIPIIDVICFFSKKAADYFKKSKFALPTAGVLICVFAIISNAAVYNPYIGETLDNHKSSAFAELMEDKTVYYVSAEREYAIQAFSAAFRKADYVYPAHNLDNKLLDIVNQNVTNVKNAYIVVEDAIENRSDEFSKKSDFDFIQNTFKTGSLKYKWKYAGDYFITSAVAENHFYLFEIEYE